MQALGDHVPSCASNTTAAAIVSSDRIFQIPEIIELILQYIPPLELLGSCRAVCRAWKEVISTSWLIRYYSITGLRPTQPLSAITLLRLTPAARALLSLFWTRLHSILSIPDIKKRRDELVTKLYMLYSSFRYPFQTVVFLQPPPGHQENLSYYKFYFTAPLRPKKPREDAATFERTFTENEEESLGDADSLYPLQNVAYALCQRAYCIPLSTFFSPSGYYNEFYRLYDYGGFTHFKARSILFKVVIPREIKSRLGRGHVIERIFKPDWRILSANFSRGEPLSVEITSEEYS